ncbi:SHD1 domain-containing protein [Anatilimnocola floriformis]|uniref:SHD1 domain-containing protein n=1 Tax=Anatilimnocola floriformis TaxID=2948575 RepID=UPI0020C44DA9|nr:SHD1 domain-containing protein [Anatilimnocola floriformis]
MKLWLTSLLFSFVLCSLPFAATPAQEKPAAEKGALRTWKAKEGTFSTEAKLLEKKGEEVVLERQDGKVITVPLAKLSFDDRVYVADWLKNSVFGGPATPAKPVTPPASGDTPAPAKEDAFDAAAVLKSWDVPYEPVQLTLLSRWKLDRKPDYLEFTADGELVYAAFYREAKHLIYQAKDAKLLHTIEYGTAPLTAAAISPDGKHLVTTLGDKGCGVYDIAAQKEVFVHERPKNTTRLLMMAGKSTWLVASQPNGVWHRYPLLGGRGLEVPLPRPADAAGEAPEPAADTHTELASSADGTRLLVSYSSKLGGVLIATFNEDGTAKDPYVVPIRGPLNGPVAMGNRISCFQLVNNQLFWMRQFDEPGNSPLLPFRLLAPAPPQIFVSPDDQFSMIFEPTPGVLTFKHLNSMYSKGFQLYDQYKPELVRMNWGQERLAFCDAEGGLEILKFSGLQSPAQKIDADLQAWLLNKQDDRIEKMAAVLEKEKGEFAGTMGGESKLKFMVNYLLTAQPLRYIKGHPPLVEWNKRAAETRLGRYHRLELAIGAAWRSRGGGFANTVTPEGWKGFHEKLAEAEEIVESFAKEATIPPIAYPLIFDVAKGQQWDEDRVKKIVERMLKECPENHPAHASYSETLMPRWGGEIDDCKKYAERLVKEFPGPVGEGAYTAIALRLHNYHAAGIFDELGLDREKAQAGVKHLFRDQLDTPRYRQTELLMAILARNSEKAREWKAEIVRKNDAWLPGVMQEAFFTKIMTLLN